MKIPKDLLTNEPITWKEMKDLIKDYGVEGITKKQFWQLMSHTIFAEQIAIELKERINDN